MKTFYSVSFLVIAYVILTISNCSIPSVKESLRDYEKKNMVTNLENVGNNVVIVGRFVVDPPLKKDDVIIHQPDVPEKYSSEPYRNLIRMGVSDKLPPNDYSTRPLDRKDPINKNSIIKKLEKTFYFKAPKKSFYLTGGYTIKRLVGKYTFPQWYIFPARYKINIRSTDKAIYIGTLYYKRDEFGSMESKVKDEYKKAKKQFIKKFGRKVKLNKRLMKPVN